ncbi:2,3-bisphosphoglycerate-independent phosphoglycerate mutase-like [Lytechinus variegatus]|uniref:2,3-bisphosphoglycerate-independent phosphoglycerate mutase-like n=1 Tax=Lytechinus variegatus TaxID=7654 RepID=UPI001BB155FF|nr:2,3-bisphosphoglycerate-independent phosphoglycerate mutase-like [Lytechinus variegatus]
MKVCLVVIDGWGISEDYRGNAILNAKTPVMDGLSEQSGEFVSLDASGLAVGLPEGLMGNSEVGHLTIGAGRAMYQSIVKIDLAIKQKTLFSQKAYVDACQRAKAGNGRMHLLGLVSDGGVHSHINHLFALLGGMKEAGVPQTFVHFFADGRDTSPTSGVKYLKQTQDKLAELQYGSLATVMGRYYAMDRDKRDERIKVAFEGLVQGIGEATTKENVIQLVQSRYDKQGSERQTDEFLTPIIVDKSGCIRDGDTLMFIDFRADRMRQIVEAFAINRNFETSVVPQNISVTCMTEYKASFNLPVIFPPETPKNVLAEWLATKRIPQYHCAETEKYAHVTFFFNGGVEKQFDGEERKLVPSPKVATYDLKPEMSVQGVADEVASVVKSNRFPFVMCNLAPPDMVGHTGVYEATVKACEATDVAIDTMRQACAESGYAFLVTADHGNAEIMLAPDGSPSTKHTTMRVPFIMNNSGRKFKSSFTHNPSLQDVAPTVLSLMDTDIPPEMAGFSLV